MNSVTNSSRCLGGDRDGQELVRQFGVAADLRAGAGDGLAGFFDPGPPAGFVDEGEGGAGPLAFEFGGAEGVGAHDPDRGGAQGAGGGAVVPVGDRQIRQRRAVVARELDRFVEQGQAPHGPAFVEDAGGFPFDVGLGEDGFDDLAHLAVADEGVAVAVDRQDRPGVGAADGLPALAPAHTPGCCRCATGPGKCRRGRVPSPARQDAGFGPGSGVVIEDVAFAVPGHLADREHGFDVCWHASNSLQVWVDQIAVMSVLPGRCPAPGATARLVRGACVRQPGDARGQVRPAG